MIAVEDAGAVGTVAYMSLVVILTPPCAVGPLRRTFPSSAILAENQHCWQETARVIR